MKKLVIVLCTFLISSCGQSQEEREKIAAVTCAVMSETRNMDAAIRVEKINEAREKIGGEPFLAGDDKIKEAVGYDLCAELILDDGSYGELLAIEQEMEQKREREKEQRLAELKEKEEQRLQEVKEKERQKAREIEEYTRSITVDAVDALNDFKKCQSDEKPCIDRFISIGEKVYNEMCAACHQSNGQGFPPVFPSLTTQQFLKRKKSEHISIVADGKVGTTMFSFRSQLNEAGIAAVITYTLNSWGNSSSSKTRLVTTHEVLMHSK